MTEQLAFQQIFGDSAAVDFDERLIVARALLMDGIDHDLFACACFPADQDIHIVILGQYADFLSDPADGGALSQ